VDKGQKKRKAGASKDSGQVGHPLRLVNSSSTTA
jgi:hypothetical protein